MCFSQESGQQWVCCICGDIRKVRDIDDGVKEIWTSKMVCGAVPYTVDRNSWDRSLTGRDIVHENLDIEDVCLGEHIEHQNPGEMSVKARALDL